MSDVVIVHPELALAGYDATRELPQSAWDEETYVRDEVYSRAHAELDAVRLASDPANAVSKAVRASSNLLSPYERSYAVAWASRTPPEEVHSAVEGLLRGPGDLLGRAGSFLGMAGLREDGDKKIGWNPTSVSYLLAMSDPDRYAFAKPRLVFQPAVDILARRAGTSSFKTSGAERVEFASRFYGAVRDLWRRKRDFDGDLLDVHTILFFLGRGHHKGASWFDAIATSPGHLALLAREYADANPTFDAPLKAASTLMREHFLDLSTPDDPLHGLDLDSYAYGTGRDGFCKAVEHSTRKYIGIAIGNVSAHEVGLAKDGTWRLATKKGKTRDQAGALFHSNVLPRLRDLAAAARRFLDGASFQLPTAPKLQSYRSIDAKTFHLLAAGLDPERTRDDLVAVLNWGQLWNVCALLGVAEEDLWSFGGYVAMQDRIRAAIRRLPPSDRPSGFAIACWLYSDPAGKLIQELQSDQDRVEDLDDPVVDPDVEPEDGKVKGSLDPAKWDDFLSSLDDDLRDVGVLLRNRTNVVLYGPPGTGKTWLSERLAQAWRLWQGESDPTDARSVQPVTFHPSYGYEDFVEAFRPVPDEAGRFALRPGPLPILAEEARRNPQRRYLLLIDELNRGDVARILGELITLLERDKRSARHARRRMLSGELLWLPPNLYVLGTMNTADKSISLLDVAVRRRFAFALTPPDPSVFASASGVVSSVAGLSLGKLLDELNHRLLDIGVLPDRLIGHALLLLDVRDDSNPMDALADRFRYDIIPLVEEYCFSDRTQMKRVLGRLVDENGAPNDELLADGPGLVDELRSLVGLEP